MHKITSKINESDGSFVIDDFSSITSDAPLYSPPFTAAGHEWRIEVNPRGDDDGKGTHLSVYLELVGSDAIDATYELAVVSKGKVKKKTAPGGYAFKPGGSWGWRKFLALDEIKKGGWLHDGKLVVTANIRDSTVRE